MFRIISCANISRCLLYLRTPEVPKAAISRHSPAYQIKKWHQPERKKCPKPAVKSPPPKNDSMFWGAVTCLTITAGFAVYAERNPQVRDWLSMHAAWFDDIIAVVYQENMTYLEFAMACTEDVKKRLAKILETPKECPNEIIVPGKPDGYLEPSDLEEEEVTPCDLLPAPVYTKDICEIEACMKDLGNDIINNYWTAKDACRYYNTLVDDTLNQFTITGLKKLRAEMIARHNLVKKSIKNAEASLGQLNDLVRYMECGGVCDQKQKVESAKQLMQEYRDQIKTMKIEYQWENARALSLDEQWQQVEVVIDRYVDEISHMYQELNYAEEKPGIQADGDLLLLHTRKYVTVMEAELKDAITAMTRRVDRGVESLSQTKQEKDATDNKIKTLYNKRKGELENEFKNRLTQLKVATDKATKDALNQQLKRLQELCDIKLRDRESEVMKTFNKMVSDQVAIQKKPFDLQLREMSIKLAEVEARLKGRLKIDQETKRSQELWAAGASLLAATKKGGGFIKVTKELRAIEKASGDDDKLVVTVLHGIPQSVWDKGVVPESVLREKYHAMENVALNVALVEHDGAPLPVYVMSWIQSIFLFHKVHTIPQIELDNPPKEPYNFTHLDTFDLLQRARYFVERGNIPAALRYVNALKGASRTAAATWYEAARAHIETRQAAEAIIAHAAAIGLQYI